MDEYAYYNMYREVNELSQLNKLFTTLLAENINIMNYLSNVVIENKMNLTNTLEELSYLISDSIVIINDLIKIKGGFPIYTLSDIELTSNIKTHVSQEYKEGSVIDNLKKEINIILNIIKEIITRLNINNSYETITELSNISYNLRKILLTI